jgi:hypothetical protein
MQNLEVRIEGMNAGTGEVGFRAKAWNADPLVPSERAVQDLTTLALETAWKEPMASHASQQEKTSEMQAEAMHTEEIQAKQMQVEEIRAEEIHTAEKVPAISPVPTESSGVSPGDQSVSMESIADSREQETVFTEPVPEEMPPAPVVDEPVAAERSVTSEDPSLGLQIASGALSLLYTPVKIVYAGIGGIIGGLVYVLTAGNEQVAQSVWDASIHGTYWVTPGHLQGNEPIYFKGEPGH